MGRMIIDAAELRGQLNVMSACAGGMSGPAVIKWVLRTIDELEREEHDNDDKTADGERA